MTKAPRPTRHIISINDLSNKEIETIFEVAQGFLQNLADPNVPYRIGRSTDLPGLTVDAELRWAILRRLAATGRAGDAEIDAELARDRTDAGRRNGLTARASIPDVPHKEAAWRQVAEPSGLGLEDSVMVARAFNAPEHAELIAPFAERYFRQLPVIWTNHEDMLRATLGHDLFPYAAAGPELLSRIEEFLAQPDLDPSLGRAVIEGRDVVQKALRSRALPD